MGGGMPPWYLFGAQASAAEVLRSGGADTDKRFPTWFSASSVPLRTSIITVFGHLLKGAGGQVLGDRWLKKKPILYHVCVLRLAAC
jgi:hypothetical protein